MRCAFSCTFFLQNRVIWHSFFFISPIMGSGTHRRSQGEHRQGSEGGHAHLKTFRTSSCFMLWEAVYQTEYCCSFKVKIVAPPKRFVATSLLEPPCDVKFLQKFPTANLPNFLKITSARKSVSFDALISFALHSDLWQVMVEREFYCFGATDKCHNGQSGQENRRGLLSWFPFCEMCCISNYFL